MLVGNAGTGKSVLVGDKLESLDADKYIIKNVSFNFYTTSAMLQGRIYGLLLAMGYFQLSIIKLNLTAKLTIFAQPYLQISALKGL